MKWNTFKFIALAIYTLASALGEPIWATSCSDALQENFAQFHKALSSRDHEDNVYAVHITDYLPMDGYIRAITKNRGRFSPTLHFSLGEPVVDHPWGNWSDKSYALVTPLRSLREQILNLYPQDTFILGDFKLPKEAVLFAPRGLIIPPSLSLKVVYYDKAAGVKSAISDYLKEIGSLQFKTEGMMGKKVMFGETNLLEGDHLVKFFPQLFADKKYLSRTSHDYTAWGQIDYTIIEYLSNWLAGKGPAKEPRQSVHSLLFFLRDRLIEVKRISQKMKLPKYAQESYLRGLEELETYLNIFEVEAHLRSLGISLFALDPRSNPTFFSKVLSTRQRKSDLLALTLAHQHLLPRVPQDMPNDSPRVYEQMVAYSSMEDLVEIFSERFPNPDDDTRQQMRAVLANRAFQLVSENRLSAVEAFAYFKPNAEAITEGDFLRIYGNILDDVAGAKRFNSKAPGQNLLQFLKIPWVHQFFQSAEAFDYFSPTEMEHYLKQLSTVPQVSQ